MDWNEFRKQNKGHFTRKGLSEARARYKNTIYKIPKPKDPSSIKYEIHHFLTNKNVQYKGFTQQFKKITDKYGLDLDDDWNKRLLPHRGKHPYAYHEYMLESVKGIDEIAKGDVKVFLSEFEKLKDIITQNPEMLYSEYWKDLGN